MKCLLVRFIKTITGLEIKTPALTHALEMVHGVMHMAPLTNI